MGTMRVAILCAAAGWCLVQPVWGQQEQWLRFRAGESWRFIAGAGQNPTPSEQPPPGVAMPSFNSRKPLFVLWQSCHKNADGGLWVALDSSTADGLYDRFYIDTNNNHSLADEEPVAAKSTEQNRPDYKRVNFDSVMLTLPGADGPAAYSLSVVYKDQGGKVTVGFRSTCWYEGEITVGSKKLGCILADDNANGVFNEVSPGDGGDRIRIGPLEAVHTFFQGYPYDRSPCRYIKIEGTLYALEVAPDGAYVKLTAAKDVPMGSISLDPSVTEVNVWGPTGDFVATVKDGVAAVPAGKYIIRRWKATKTSPEGAQWTLAASVTNARGQEIAVEPGGEAKVDLLGGVVAQVRVSRSNNGYLLTQELVGQAGEEISMQPSVSQPPPPQVHIANADGTYSKSYPMAYG